MRMHRRVLFHAALALKHNKIIDVLIARLNNEPH